MKKIILMLLLVVLCSYSALAITTHTDRVVDTTFNGQDLSLELIEVNPDSGGYKILVNDNEFENYRLSAPLLVADYVMIKGYSYNSESVEFTLLESDQKLDITSSEDNSITTYTYKPVSATFNGQDLSIALRDVNTDNGAYKIVVNGNEFGSKRLSEPLLVEDYVMIKGHSYNEDSVTFYLLESNNELGDIPVISNACSDTDAGKDYGVKGTVTYAGAEHEDYCMPGQDKFLVEAYCEDNFQKLETVECEDRCENGRCVSGNIATGDCKDSEEGIDIYNKGYVISSGNRLYDYCDDNSVVDYICMGNTPKEDRTVCPYGCKEGACITSINPSQGCTDSDDGQDYFTKGKVNWAGNEIYDYCSTKFSNVVYEQYCYNNELKYERYECPNICSDGRCTDKVTDEYKGFLSLAVNSKEVELIANQRQNKIVLKYYGGDSNNPSVCGLEVNGEGVEFMEGQTKIVEGVKISLIDIVPGSKSAYPRCEVNIKAMACIDSDGSKNYFEKGYVDFESELAYDYCNEASENQLTEYYCTDNDQVDTVVYDCPDRCKNGVCIHETEEVILPEGFVDNVGDNCNSNEDCSSHNCANKICRPYCEGCMLRESCIPYGTRLESDYCDITKTMKSQKAEYESCSNNYECTTNLCVDSQCVSSNLIQKIIQWFKNLFG